MEKLIQKLIQFSYSGDFYLTRNGLTGQWSATIDKGNPRFYQYGNTSMEVLEKLFKTRFPDEVKTTDDIEYKKK